MATMIAEARSRTTERRRWPSRLRTNSPVTFTIVGSGDGILAWGRAIISDIGDSGLRLSRASCLRGFLPLEPHYQVVVVPSNTALRDLWIRVRPVHVRFSRNGAEIGTEIVSTSEGIHRLFHVLPLLE